MKRFVKFVCYLSILAIFTCSGIFLGINIEKKAKEKQSIENMNNTNNGEAVTTFNNIKKEESLEIVKETYYKECQHTVITQENQYAEDIKKLKETVKEENNDYTVKSDYANKIVFSKEVEGICMHHYTLKPSDGYVAVYVLKDGSLTIQEITNIPISQLKKEVQKQLEVGIKVETQEKLISMLEDMES